MTGSAPAAAESHPGAGAPAQLPAYHPDTQE
jgi:hypothetical protein